MSNVWVNRGSYDELRFRCPECRRVFGHAEPQTTSTTVRYVCDDCFHTMWNTTAADAKPRAGRG